MTKPVPDKAEVAVEFPDKFYIGTFEQTARFDARLDESGISLSLHRSGPADTHRSVGMHFHYGLFADILRELANTAAALPADDVMHREALRDGAKALYDALSARATEGAGADDASHLSAGEEVRLLHIME